MNDKFTILIADDSETQLAHLQHILERASYRVIKATSGNEAIKLCAEMLPDIILLDVIMDDGDGYAACRAFKKDPNTCDIPVIMISEKSSDAVSDWAKTLGAADYIAKPFDELTLLELLAPYRYKTI